MYPNIFCHLLELLAESTLTSVKRTISKSSNIKQQLICNLVLGDALHSLVNATIVPISAEGLSFRTPLTSLSTVLYQ